VGSVKRRKLTLFIFSSPKFDVSSLSSLISFASSYLRLLATMLIQDGRYHSPCTYNGVLLEYLDGYEAAGALSEEDLAFTSLFDGLSIMLNVSDSPQIVAMLLETLSVLAVQNQELNLDNAIAISWSSLHTVYAHERDGMKFTEPPFLISHCVSRHASLHGDSGPCTALRQVFESSVLRLSQKVLDCKRPVPHYCVSLLQLWGLVTHSSNYTARYAHYFSSMCDELACFVASLDKTAETTEEKKENNSGDAVSLRRSHPLPFLCATSFEEVFSYLLNMVVGAMAVCEPASSVPLSCGAVKPFTHFHLVLRNFRSLLEVYQKHFVVFPSRSSMDAYHASRFCLTAAVNQLQRCAEWRQNQPLLSWEDKDAGAYDPGATKYLQDLLDEMFSCTSTAVLDLCDFWERSGNSLLHSRTTRLRQMAEKAAQKLKDFATAYNWPAPIAHRDCASYEGIVVSTTAFVPDSSTITAEAKPGITNVSSADGTGQANTESCGGDKGCLDEDDGGGGDDDSEDSTSFGVAGGWGDGGGDSKDDSSVESLQLHCAA